VGLGRLEHRERRDMVGECSEHGRGCVRADRELGHICGDEFRVAVLVEVDVQRRHRRLERRVGYKHVPDVLWGNGVQPQHRELERAARVQPRIGVRLGERAVKLHQGRDLLALGGDAARGLPDVEQLERHVRRELLAHVPQRRQHRHGRDGVADEPEHGDDDLRSDRRLGHVGRDEHGQLVLPLEYREADIQRRRLEVERRIGVEHVCGMLRAIASHLVAGARSMCSEYRASALSTS